MRDAVRGFWDAHPCATGDVPGADEATPEFFQALDERRYSLEPFIEPFAAFREQVGLRVLEVGCGTGGDLFRFARAGARTIGVDLSRTSLDLVRRRFDLMGRAARVILADAESLPFFDESFDLVYSWGVLHHAPDPARAIAEVHRVLASGGRARVMLYHRHSLVALQVWLRYGLLRGRLRTSFAAAFAENVESPGTKAYTISEVGQLFVRAGFADVNVTPVLTPWDARVGRRLFLPGWFRVILPNRWGFFLLVSARRGP
jgi:ubiquinone/menaquinone biosynthesis C-methylase UbiE